MSLYAQIANLVISHLDRRYGNDNVYASQILESIKILLHNNIDNYDFCNLSELTTLQRSKVDNIQGCLSKINEKEIRRKKEGVYYTDHDVTDFIVCNALLHYADSSISKVYGYHQCYETLYSLSKEKITEILNTHVLDPTCGTGEFLLSTFDLKLKLNKKFKKFSHLEILKTIYGNDIENQSTEITKLRLFFLFIDNCDKITDFNSIIEVLNNNFSNIDAINYDGKSLGFKDIIVGNPPYVEYRNYERIPQNKYGNVYADILHNSINCLDKYGIMAFVIPLSYVSTIRMSTIRDYILNHTNKQIVINFADRPDCLFTNVHQKLTILIAQCNSEYSGILSSSYNYWYRKERENLFNNLSLYPILNENSNYLPKIGNDIEYSIYEKIYNLSGNDILSGKEEIGKSVLYINLRGCFWMKVFTYNVKSNSYSKFYVLHDKLSFVYCLINSSLFFLLWVIISDGWHITNKELTFIKIPKNIGDNLIWDNLRYKLEDALENTKVFVGTKQVDFEYKHKECKFIIDEIDDALAKVYKLTDLQLHYIKNFALKYRLGDESKN